LFLDECVGLVGNVRCVTKVGKFDTSITYHLCLPVALIERNPSHELIDRQLGQSVITLFSVLEKVGRTLKGKYLIHQPIHFSTVLYIPPPKMSI